MKKIKISNPLKLGLLLSVPMFLAGIASGVVAYRLGYESLKGVSQPDINPAKKFTNDRTNYGRNQRFVPVKEADVIKRVKVYIEQQKKNPKRDDKKSEDAKQSFLTGDRSFRRG